MSRDNKDLVVGLDIGTSKISAVVAQLGSDGRLDILGLATQEAQGLKKGVVVNIEATIGGDAPDREADAPAEGAGPPMPEDMPEFFRRFFGQPGMPQPGPRGGVSQGSGFIMSADGYVLTNHHVVEGADDIVVRLADRREFKAELVGSDPLSDVALLKVEGSGLPTLALGDSRNLKPGQWVVAIGSPFGFEHSVTAGIVSGVGRRSMDPSQQYVPFIQTDVAINRGNSGGPLLNTRGEVVGINSQIFSNSGGYMGVSFAIPIEVAMNAVPPRSGAETKVTIEEPPPLRILITRRTQRDVVSDVQRLLGTLGFDDLAAGNNDVFALVVDLDDFELVNITDVLVEVFRRDDVDLRTGKECFDTDIDGKAAFDDALDFAADESAILEHLDDFFPVLALGRFFFREDHHALVVLETLELGGAEREFHPSSSSSKAMTESCCASVKSTYRGRLSPWS